MKIDIPFLWWILRIRIWRKVTRARGYNSKSGNLHVGMIDVDSIGFTYLVSRIREVQEGFGLGNAYVFESRPDSFHVVFLDLDTFHFWLNVMEELDHNRTIRYQAFCMSRYDENQNPDPRMVLRLTPKEGNEIKFVGTVKSDFGKKYCSFAHYQLLKYLTGNKVIRPRYLRGPDSVQFEDYQIVRGRD